MKLLSSLLALASLAALASGSVACGDSSSSDDDPTADSDLTAGKTDHWFYDGPMPALEEPSITVSLAGNTARVSGYLPARYEDGSPVALNMAELPHARVTDENGRKHIDVVYPIASARPGKSNSRPGRYGITQGKLFRPDGIAVTAAEGRHNVTWGGFPFIPYNGGIAFHGPITAVNPGQDGDAEADKVWHLLRGRVSGGCNRMMGEHVVELARLVGFDMREVRARDTFYDAPRRVPVTILSDTTYDTFQGKKIDVDYPTDAGITRPTGDVEMFGSWVASDVTDGSDLPGDEAWEGGVRGVRYVFGKHARQHWVCSLPLNQLSGMRGKHAPKGFCGAPRAAALR